MNYRDIITIEHGKRGGKPCIRGMRITVYDVLDYLASGMTVDEILDDFPYLTETDIQHVLRMQQIEKNHKWLFTRMKLLQQVYKTSNRYTLPTTTIIQKQRNLTCL